MPKTLYTLSMANDIRALSLELQRILDDIAIRLNFIDYDGDDTTLYGGKITGIDPGTDASDAIRYDQVFLLANLATTIFGTTNRIIVTDNGDETITLSTPQNLDTSADVTFDSITLNDLTQNSIPYVNALSKLLETNPGFVFDGTHLYLNLDNSKLYFGTGSDTSLYYDGTDFWINGHAAGSGKVNIGDATNRVEIDNVGDVNFVGGSGLQFAQIHEEDGSSTIDLAAQDTYYQVTAFSANGESNGATPDHTNDHITIAKAGMYLVTLNVSFAQTTAVSIEYDFHVLKNNGATDYPAISAHRDTSGATVVGNCGCTGIIDLAANDTVEVWVKRLSGGAVSRTIIIPQCSLTVTQIGGT